jgi:quinoprotein relay system zinc metallohydrolase 2
MALRERRIGRALRAGVRFAVGSLSVALWAATPAIGADRGAAFNLAEAAPGVFVHLGRPLALDAPGHDDIANIGFVIGRRCVAVIDTGGSVSVGRELRAAIRQHTSLPICYVINTHVHIDHVLGNFAFKDEKPSFVGHAALAEAIARSRPYFLREYAEDFDAPANENQVVGPDRLVEQELILDVGSRRLHLRAWARAHSDCDLTVYDERTSTLWTGDLLFRERLPALDGSITGWLSAIDELASQKVKLAIPGHGALARDLASALEPERGYLQALLAGVRRELAQGESLPGALKDIGDAGESQWLLWAEVHPRNVARAYEELEWE